MQLGILRQDINRFICNDPGLQSKAYSVKEEAMDHPDHNVHCWAPEIAPEVTGLEIRSIDPAKEDELKLLGYSVSDLPHMGNPYYN